MNRKRKKHIAVAVLSAFFIYLGFLRYPKPLFAHSLGYDNLRLNSDLTFPSYPAFQLLREARQKLQTSRLFNPLQEYEIFVCNSRWLRFMFFLNPWAAGGKTLPYFTGSFIGPADFIENRVFKPNGEKAPKNRTLDYFIAHEITHEITRETVGDWKFFWLPKWLVEGYADYIAQGRNFDPKEQLRVLRSGVPQTDIWQTEYDRYNLAVTYLLNEKKMDIVDLLANPPHLEDIEDMLKRNGS